MVLPGLRPRARSWTTTRRSSPRRSTRSTTPTTARSRTRRWPTSRSPGWSTASTTASPTTSRPSSTRSSARRRAASSPGIGVTVAPDPRGLRVVQVFDQSPAQRAGIRARRRHHRRRPPVAEGPGPDQGVVAIKGPSGTDVRLVSSAAAARAQVDGHARDGQRAAGRPRASSRYGGEKVGYVALAQFGSGAHAEVYAALKKLEARGAKRYVFDLRHNGGGLVSEAQLIASRVPEDGPIVTTQGPQRADAHAHATGDPVEPDAPLVVLVDRDTASASEIVTGALQDRDRAEVVGTRTFGKGVFQEVVELSNGGALDITAGQYFTPKGRNLGGRGVQTGTGIKPDVQASDDPRPRRDEALDAALKAVATLGPGGEPARARSRAARSGGAPTTPARAARRRPAGGRARARPARRDPRPPRAPPDRRAVLRARAPRRRRPRPRRAAGRPRPAAHRPPHARARADRAGHRAPGQRARRARGADARPRAARAASRRASSSPPARRATPGRPGARRRRRRAPRPHARCRRSRSTRRPRADYDDAITRRGARRRPLAHLGPHRRRERATSPPGSPVDREAYRRATSVYVPGRGRADAARGAVQRRVLAASRRRPPGGDRRARAARRRRGRAARSRARRSAPTRAWTTRAWTASSPGEEQAAAPWAEPLAAARAAARALAARRERRGALAIESSEPEFAFDPRGHVTGLDGRASRPSPTG